MPAVLSTTTTKRLRLCQHYSKGMLNALSPDVARSRMCEPSVQQESWNGASASVANNKARFIKLPLGINIKLKKASTCSTHDWTVWPTAGVLSGRLCVLREGSTLNAKEQMHLCVRTPLPSLFPMRWPADVNNQIEGLCSNLGQGSYEWR